jgi:hypothetical protein
MKRGNIFWGICLIILGGLFFLRESGIVSNVFGWFWPLVLIMLGGWILIERFIPAEAGDPGESFSVDLQGAAKMELDFELGAGSVQLAGGAAPGTAVSGTQATGMEMKNSLVGDTLEVKIEAGPSFLPFLGPSGGVWQLQLNRDLPVTLKMAAGASTLDLDLTDLKVTNMKIEIGASTLKVKLPANAGSTSVDIDSGAATLDLSVPQGVALRLRAQQGASSFHIDQARFPMQAEGLYQSADYDTAANKVEIDLDGGANTVNIT